MTDTPLKQWLSYLETLHPNPMDLGLARVGRVARELGLVPVSVPVVTVAGTNGKGSTVAVLEALLARCGKRPGAFTSPHLLRFNERIRIAGAEVADAPILRAFEAIEAARGETTLTYFEFGLLAALWVFRDLAVDVVILEVGLGGRLDAANIVDADVAVITSIDLDHQQWLGDSRDAIAREKAGIMRPGRAVVVAEPDPPAALLEAVQETGAAPLYLVGRDFLLADDTGRGVLTLRDSGGAMCALPFAGHPEILTVNIAAALQSAQLLGVHPQGADLDAALAGLSLWGRRQHREIAGRDYLFDVAHNPAAVLKLVEKFVAEDCRGRRIALFSAMKDKAVAEMLRPCIAHVDYWLLPDQPGNERAQPAAATAAMLREAGIDEFELCADLPAATARCRELLAPGDCAVVFGSFYTVGGVLASLEEGPRAAVSNE